MSRMSAGRRALPSLWKRLLCLILFFALVGVMSAQEENFSCHAGIVRKLGDEGVIIPRSDIILEVGEQSKEVLCRFNSSAIDVKDVFFATDEGTLPHEVVNSSTIRVTLFHDEPRKYLLYCNLQRKNKVKELCSQYVKAGYPPLDIKNLSCISDNNLNVNCSWENPYNPVATTYLEPNYTLLNFMKEKSPCSKTNPPFYTWCQWEKSSRDHVGLLISGVNALGNRTYNHSVYVPLIVLPRQVAASVHLTGPTEVKVVWNLTYPLDVFSSGLRHKVEYRIKGEQQWNTVDMFRYKHSLLSWHIKRVFSRKVKLPLAFTEYEFRVRIHTGVGEIRENMWSPFYPLLTIMSEATRPGLPGTSSSSFEVVEMLGERDIYVNFRHVMKKYQAGKDFRYDVDVYSAAGKLLDIKPIEETRAYFKYKSMEFSEYRFEIWSANEKGSSNSSAKVIVPNAECMPKKTGMFTVILISTDKGKIFSLYWLPSRSANKQCPGSKGEVDSYSIFWCKKTVGSRCKDRLDWEEIHGEDLIEKSLSDETPSHLVIYEYNVTKLSDTEMYTFGIAANSGNFSSGIRWSSCVVDATEAPLAPVTEVEALANNSRAVFVKWELKCGTISAVPIGFNVSYCKSEVEDFGHCTSAIQHKRVDSPDKKLVLIADLDAGSSYIFSVAVMSIIGEGIQSHPRLMRLREDIPTGPPLHLKAISQTNTSFTLSWDPPLKLRRGGLISHYAVTILPSVGTHIVNASHDEDEPVKYTVEGLHAFTSYAVTVKACTAIGCAYKMTASVAVKTKAGAPGPVDRFYLDVSSWSLIWDLGRCNSRICSFELKLPVNRSHYEIVSVDDKETFSLRSRDLACNFTEMTFWIRAKGHDEQGYTLYGPWQSVVKDAPDCPPEPLSWWVITIIVFVCMILLLIISLIAKYGWRTIMKAIKDWKQKINLPKGIQVAEPTKEPLKEFNSFPGKGAFTTGDADAPLFLSKTTPRNSEDRTPSKLRADSVSSEEVHLIDSSDLDRHGRNLSGSSDQSRSSDRSLGQDSAFMSASPSLNQNETMENLHSELPPSSSQETTLRQRPYVQHGVIPEKLSEGYVTAWSVPSLPHLYKDGLDGLQQSSVDLKRGLRPGFQEPRRASTEYTRIPASLFSQTSDSPCKDLSLPVMLVQEPSAPYTRLPALKDFIPELKMDSIKGGYVTLGDGRSDPSSTDNNDVGYVSAGDPALKRPPSLPFIPKSVSVGEEDLPLGAYCRVGSRGNPPNTGYVSASQVGSLVPSQAPSSEAKKSPYVSCMEAASIPSGQIQKESSPSNIFSPYVELQSTGKWGHPLNYQPPNFASQSVEEGFGSRVGHLPRPNTTEAAMGHSRSNGLNPSLSKQSSGYVSQETIAPCEAVVMSPKRLLTQASTAPHTVVMSPSHHASMV